MTDNTFDTITQRLDEGQAKMAAIEGRLDAHAVALAENTTSTRAIEVSTAELVEFLNAMKGAFRVLDIIGKAAKPLSYIAAVVAAVLGIVTTIKGMRP
jgi:fibrillarin-like rRNA methylase